MVPKLTPEQQQALDANKGSPLRLIDERTNAIYILLPVDVFENAANGSADAFNPRELYPHIWNVMKEDWEDPAMDVYDNYPEKK